MTHKFPSNLKIQCLGLNIILTPVSAIPKLLSSTKFSTVTNIMVCYCYVDCYNIWYKLSWDG